MYSKQTETCGSFTQQSSGLLLSLSIHSERPHSIITHNEINTMVSNSLNFKAYSQQAETEAKAI